MRIGRLICGVAACLTPLAVAAQQTQGVTHGIGIGVMAGGTVPLSDYGDVANGAWNVGGLIDWGRATNPLGLRLDVTYHGFSDKNFASVGGGASAVTIGNSSRIVDGDVNVVIGTPRSSSTIRPYLLGGGGVYGIRNELTCKSELICNGTLGSDSQTKFGLDGGAGIELGLSGFDAFIEGRYHHVFDALPDRSCVSLPGCGRVDASFLPFTFGLIFRF